MNTTHHIPATQHPYLFLVSQGGVGFLVSWRQHGIFGHLCPWCLNCEERQRITDAVDDAFNREVIIGKINWCSHAPDRAHGNQLYGYPPLRQEHFSAGSANAGILPEVRELIRREALRLKDERRLAIPKLA